jgi:farnesyl-diphosphate farnesyltransferase
MSVLIAEKNKNWTLMKAATMVAKSKIKSTIKQVTADQCESLSYCYYTLDKVSRSFAVVIRQLSPELRDAVCVFYLALRALDTIEDDLSTDFDQRMSWLNDFHNNIGNPAFRLKNVGDTPDYIELMENYHHVAIAYNGLKPKYQSVIKEIAREMGLGMAHFAQNEVITKADYDKYCHYVAGLVGIGLSQLFAASGIENQELLSQLTIANSMGLFLQKTNITRDYAEDVEQGRFFWPKEIWSQYADEKASMYKNPSPESMQCLNHMVNNALAHYTDCLDYLTMLQDKSVFRFCAIPQVMALATLRLVYNNPLVFSENVKMDKADSAYMFNNCNNMSQLKKISTNLISNWKIEGNDDISEQTKALIHQISQKLK